MSSRERDRRMRLRAMGLAEHRIRDGGEFRLSDLGIRVRQHLAPNPEEK